jgi:hypothetical protein
MIASLTSYWITHRKKYKGHRTIPAFVIN